MFYSLAPTNIPKMKALAQILLEISCTQDFHTLFSKGHNSEKGHTCNSDLKKIWVNYFFMRNVHMKFQNTSIHCSKVNRCTHPSTHPSTHTHTHTDKPKAICPSNFFKVGGIKTKRNSCSGEGTISIGLESKKKKQVCFIFFFIIIISDFNHTCSKHNI